MLGNSKWFSSKHRRLQWSVRPATQSRRFNPEETSRFLTRRKESYNRQLHLGVLRSQTRVRYQRKHPHHSVRLKHSLLSVQAAWLRDIRTHNCLLNPRSNNKTKTFRAKRTLSMTSTSNMRRWSKTEKIIACLQIESSQTPSQSMWKITQRAGANWKTNRVAKERASLRHSCSTKVTARRSIQEEIARLDRTHTIWK